MISIEEANFVNIEQQLLSLEVYLEKSDKPKIFKTGRSAGIIMVTNLRMFFLCVQAGKSLWTEVPKKVLTEVAFMGLGKIPVVGLVSAVAYDLGNILYHNNKNKKVNIETIIKNKDSFVIPGNNIVSCETIGNISSINSYIRITVKNYENNSTTYCIYPIDNSNVSNIKNLSQLPKVISEIKLY
jgi:hypothetical protein